MTRFESVAKRLSPFVTKAICLFAVCMPLAVGCAEKSEEAVEKTPAEIEKSRQEHIKMMELESGQTAPAESK